MFFNFNKFKMKLFLILTILITFINLVKLDSYDDIESEDANNEERWDGKWFPNKPGLLDTTYGRSSNKNTLEVSSLNRVQMGIPDELCDTGNYNLEIDFDPQRDTYLCLDDQTKFTPNYKTHPYMKVYEIPPEYVAIHKCMNETIEYEEDAIPTFGTHRPLWPRYGEYMYVPPQRWLHNLEHGGIVALFHPCANQDQINKLRAIVKSCLWRHLITSSNLTTPARPFALVAWGVRMEFSVVVDDLVTSFIKNNALRGPEYIVSDGQFDKNLIEAAKIVSTIDDAILCPKPNTQSVAGLF